jgi:hypothetical protein
MDTLAGLPRTGAASVEFGAIPEAVRAVRVYVADVLTAWAIPDDVIDMAKLLASGAVYNSQVAQSTGQNSFGDIIWEPR